MCAYKRAIGEIVVVTEMMFLQLWQRQYPGGGVLGEFCMMLLTTGENRERVDESSVFFLKTVSESITISK